MTYRCMLPVFLFLGFVLDTQSAGLDGNRMFLPGSIREISAAAGPHQAAILRRTLSPSENGEVIEFEVALQMRNFSELQQRLGRGERIATAEMAGKYFPLEADYQAVADWIGSQGL